MIKMIYNKILHPVCLVLALVAMMSLASCRHDMNGQNTVVRVDADGFVSDHGEVALPYSDDETGEKLVDENGQRVIRLVGDSRLSFPEKVKERDSCFVVMSKKDYYLYVYEPQGNDTVMVARYDCCFASNKGDKVKEGDMRTPHCTMANPFVINEIKDASTWEHDFGDGRGPIKAYGHYFHRLDTHGHKGIGIHGSTNNESSVPGRGSEGCIRLLDDDIVDFREHYAHLGMKVVIKAEEADDMPFEIHAMKKQNIMRKRHLDPAKALRVESQANVKAANGES